MATTAEVVKQALLVYSFVPIKDGKRPARSGWEYLRAQWEACAALGMTQPMPRSRTPTSFPAAQPEPGPLRRLAFARHPSRTMVYSAFLFADHDVVGLVAAIAPNDTDPHMRSWAQILQAWRGHVNRMPPAEILGEVIVLTGLYTKARSIGQIFGAGTEAVDRSVRKASMEAIGPWESVAVTASRLRIYGFAQPDVTARLQRYCLVADHSAEVTLDEWAWAREGHWGLAPFTRLCLHAAKLDYEEAVHRSAKPVSAVSSEIDSAVEDILKKAAKWSPESRVRPRDLLAADTHLQSLLYQLNGPIWRVTRSRDLHETVEIALNNVRRYVPELVARVGGPGDPFTPISDRATRLLRQIDHDIRYLEDLLERGRAAHDFVRLIVEEASQQRRERLTLLQTSVIGAVLAALAAIQALNFSVPLAESLQGPLIAFLAAVAFALPVALARWTGTMPRSAPYRWPDHAAAALLGASLGWFVIALIWHLHWHATAPWPATVGGAAAGAVLVAGGAALLVRARDRPGPGTSAPADG